MKISLETCFWQGKLPFSGDCLSREERLRCADLQDEAEQLGVINAHIIKRHLLTRHVPRLSPSDWEFEREHLGKPLVKGGGCHFNLAHSLDASVVVVASCPVGIDLEYIRPLEDVAVLARRILTKEEAAWLKQQPDPSSAMVRLWTVKESVLKAAGLGLSVLSLKKIEIQQPGSDQGDVSLPDGSEWHRHTRYCQGSWISCAVSRQYKGLCTFGLLDQITPATRILSNSNGATPPPLAMRSA